MKFSESWLRTRVNPQLDSEALAHLLTMAGLEVEELDPVAPAFHNVVVGAVLSVEKHPDADRLNVCQVDVGDGEPKTIVCGAPNVAAGLKVPCALPGASLPGDFVIKIAKVRGVQSSGMLCSAKELGIAEESSGLLILDNDVVPGQSIRELLDLDDRLFTLKLTPNRADCLSLNGIAREVAALTGAAVSPLAVSSIEPGGDLVRGVNLEAPEACPLYCGRIISGVDAKAPTPDWMRRRLERSGIRSISALVDITNYVMLELGQPLHAFDNTRLEGAVSVRWAKPGEELLLLNEQTLALQSDVLMIADQAKPLAMAGIMGGEESGISLDTTELFLESAYFSPKAIAGRARRYGFSSDASHRFERGVDFGGTRRAMERATELILSLCGGVAGPVTEACSAAHMPARPAVKLRQQRVESVLGMRFSTERIAQLLTGLDLSVEQEGADFLVTPPSWRFDIEIEEDLIEEVARIHGYDNIPAPAPKGKLAMAELKEQVRPVSRLKHFLAGRGYQEVVNFAFVEAAWEKDFAANDHPIKLANPIASQMGVMRSTMIGGLVANLALNLRRRQSRVRVFELGRCFAKSGAEELVPGYAQPLKIAGLVYGGALPEGWSSGGRRVDFFDVKGDIEALFAPLQAEFSRAEHPALHPGRSAQILLAGKAVGVIGELHPEWVQKYELTHPPVVFELALDALTGVSLPAYEEVSRYPSVTRDIAVVVDQSILFSDLLKGVRQVAPATVKEVQVFDVYTGKGVPENKKSLAFRIVMQDTQRTLLDAEVDAAMQQIMAYLEQTFSAQLRA